MPTGNVSGKVLKHSGDPVNARQKMRWVLTGTTDEHSLTTEPDGSYITDPLDLGTYYVYINPSDPNDLATIDGPAMPATFKVDSAAPTKDFKRRFMPNGTADNS